MDPDSLVSCLCVTRDRVPMLRRAVSCFLAQTHPARELVIVYDADDPATRAYRDTIVDASIAFVEAPSAERLPLGSLRNLAVQHARGRYVAQWDDDDWHSPLRLATQVEAIGRSGKAGCLLSRWILCDAQTGEAFLSRQRPWEGSLIAEKSAVPSYPPLSRCEDTDVVKRMAMAGRLTLLDAPGLYVYVFHGANTWDRVHWEGLLSGARLLGPEETQQVHARLKMPGVAAPPCE